MRNEQMENCPLSEEDVDEDPQEGKSVMRIHSRGTPWNMTEMVW